MIIKKWHVYIVDLEPRIGTKPGKQRPCLCIQPTEISKLLKSSVILPLTTNVLKEEAYPFRVKIPKDTCELNKESEVLIDQILAWDNKLFKKDLGILPEFLQEKVKLALTDFLDF
jgi:mRNA interferase MazF